MNNLPHIRYVVQALYLSLATLLPLKMQAQQVPASAIPSNEFQIERIELQGNETYDEGTLVEILQLKETPGGFSQFLYRTFGEKLGSKPEYFDPAVLKTDEELLLTYYRSHGFYHTTVRDSVSLDQDDKTAGIFLFITEGKRSFIDSIIYLGLDSIATDVREKILAAPLIVKGMPYETERSSAELARILGIFTDNGYPLARFDQERSSAVRYTSTNNFHLTFAFQPGRRYQFGEVTVRVDPPRPDITDHMVLRHLDFQPKDTYSREKRVSSERNLNRLGLFEAARVDTLGLPDSTSGSTAIPMEALVRPRPLNELAPEIILTEERNALDIGLGLGYTNRNFFGDGRSFNARTRVRSQSWGKIVGGTRLRDTTVIGAVDIEFRILQPYLFNRRLSGSWTTTLGVEKEQFYILTILRNKVGLSNQFTQETYGFLDWTLERVSPEFLTQSALYTPQTEEERPQFNSILTFTLQRDRTNDIFSPTAGNFHLVSLEESGILPKILPGIRSGLPFTQYYKVTLFGRWYEDLTKSRYNILALKFRTGYQNKYGESKYLPVNIPLNRRFFGGGSGSVRGWRARELGAMAPELLPFGGNFVLESSAEMRINYFRGFGKFLGLTMDNFWGVYFVDVGNVWSDIEKAQIGDLAVAAGLGLRYETLFGPFRIDYGFKLYNPQAAAGKQSFIHRKFFGEVLGSGVFHFGIGHAF